MSKLKIRIAIVVSHPIQHFCPQYASFSKNPDIEIKVFFGSALGYKKYIDNNFKTDVQWENLKLEQFQYCFLNGESVIQPDKNLDAKNLNRELENFQPHILFTYGYFQKLQRRAYQWSKKNKVVIAYISDSELRHQQNWFKFLLKSFFLRRYFSRMSYFLTMGNANELYYQKHGVPIAKMLRMHYPIDINLYEKSYLEKEQTGRNTRNKYSIGENEIILTVVGKLVSWKNQDHIIEAMKLLENEGIYLSLLIVGSGVMLSKWEETAEKLKRSKVYFTGFVNAEELPSFYAATDIYIHPASMEPHSVAISEAIMMGCPVILSDRCGSYGPTDDVQEDKNGFVYQFGNIRQLSEKIKILVNDERKRKIFGSYSHELGLEFQKKSHFGMMENLVKSYQKSNPNL